MRKNLRYRFVLWLSQVIRSTSRGIDRWLKLEKKRQQQICPHRRTDTTTKANGGWDSKDVTVCLDCGCIVSECE